MDGLPRGKRLQISFSVNPMFLSHDTNWENKAFSERDGVERIVLIDNIGFSLILK